MQFHQQSDQDAVIPIEGSAVACGERVLGLLDQIRSVSDRLVLDGHPLARDLIHLERGLRDAMTCRAARPRPVNLLPGPRAFSGGATQPGVAGLADTLRELAQSQVFITKWPGGNAGANT